VSIQEGFFFSPPGKKWLDDISCCIWILFLNEDKVRYIFLRSTIEL
jgi:hypothetical protein